MQQSLQQAAAAAAAGVHPSLSSPGSSAFGPMSSMVPGHHGPVVGSGGVNPPPPSSNSITANLLAMSSAVAAAAAASSSSSSSISAAAAAAANNGLASQGSSVPLRMPTPSGTPNSMARQNAQSVGSQPLGPMGGNQIDAMGAMLMNADPLGAARMAASCKLLLGCHAEIIR